jgi:hypothetical protein
MKKYQPKSDKINETIRNMKKKENKQLNVSKLNSKTRNMEKNQKENP